MAEYTYSTLTATNEKDLDKQTETWSDAELSAASDAARAAMKAASSPTDQKTHEDRMLDLQKLHWTRTAGEQAAAVIISFTALTLLTSSMNANEVLAQVFQGDEEAA